jgi:hypothetical protein
MKMTSVSNLPVVVIGAGPIGLAAAAHLIEREVPVKIFETSHQVAPNIRAWSHVRLFSVWEQCVDEAAAELLTWHGWRMPPGQALPTGGDLVEQYLRPLSEVPEIAAGLHLGSKVARITRQGLSRISSRDRAEKPFVVTVHDANGQARDVLARAVIDASGTWHNPNPIGADGWPVPGEREHADRIDYGIPDISGKDRQRFEGKRILVLGGGHSAANALLDLAYLAEGSPGTSMTWASRGASLAKVFGGGSADQLPARGILGDRLGRLVGSGRLQMELSFTASRLVKNGGGLLVEGGAESATRTIGPFDRIVVATGQRPDFSFARELQLDLHPVVESTRELGPLIDPNFHSCGTVPPHGWRELAHAEPDYFVAGIKSYGRAPTFLLLTGYEQVRSIAAHLAGDDAAADDVRLVLPETGVCNATLEEVAPGGLCCTGAAANAAEPCCERPADERASPCCAKPASEVVGIAKVPAAACC